MLQWQSNRARADGAKQGNMSTGDAGYGMKSKYDVAAMECVQPLSDHPKVGYTTLVKQKECLDL